MENSRLNNVFDTLEEANLAQEYDFGKTIQYHQSLGASQAFIDGTDAWDIPKQRLDGKFVYLVCPYSDAVHLTEEASDGWFIKLEDL